MQVLFLTNHGAVCCGESIEEAFYNVYNTVLACETQVNDKFYVLNSAIAILKKIAN